MAISQDQAGCPRYSDLKGNIQDADWARERGNTTFPGDTWQGLYELKTQTSHFLGSLPSLAASLACLEAPQGHVDPLGYPDPRGHVDPLGYPDPQGHVDPLGYPNPQGHVGPLGYPDPQGHVGTLGYPNTKEEMEVTLVLVQPDLWDIP